MQNGGRYVADENEISEFTYLHELNNRSQTPHATYFEACIYFRTSQPQIIVFRIESLFLSPIHRVKTVLEYSDSECVNTYVAHSNTITFAP